MTPNLETHLRELLDQWRETVKFNAAHAGHDSDWDYAYRNGYYECIAELEEILAGDLSSLATWDTPTPPHTPAPATPPGSRSDPATP